MEMPDSQPLETLLNNQLPATDFGTRRPKRAREIGYGNEEIQSFGGGEKKLANGY